MKDSFGKLSRIGFGILVLTLPLAGCGVHPAVSSSSAAVSASVSAVSEEAVISASVSAASADVVISASASAESDAVSAVSASSDAVSEPSPAAGTSASAVREEAPVEREQDFVTFAVKQISKHGNVILDTTFDEMSQNGMEIGDIITVKAGNGVYDIPIGTAYTDVDTGQMVCRFDTEDQEVGLVINMGSFAAETGIAKKQKIEEDPGYRWDIMITKVQLCLKEKQGYLSEYNARNLTRTNARGDYPDLTDEEFANFRAVSVTGMKENYVYRSSSPINPDLGRDQYVMTAMENAGIRSVLNLADSVEVMKSFEAWPDSYYSRCPVVNPEMSYDFTTSEFGAQVRESILFMLENEGPFLVHCKEGKDRTGMLCAVLECFAGASYEEIVQDYMLTYRNFYGVTPEQETYSIILNDNLVKTLCGMFETDQLDGADLKEESREYLSSVGLTGEQLESLSEKLGE